VGVADTKGALGGSPGVNGRLTDRFLAGVVGAEAAVVAGVWEAEGSCRLLAGVVGAEGNVGG